VVLGSHWSAGITFVFATSSGGTAFSWSPAEPGDVVNLIYFDAASLGTIPVTIDGVAQTGIVTGGTNTFKLKQYTGLAHTTHVVTSIPTATNQNFVAGWVSSTKEKRLYVHNLALGGSRANSNPGSVAANWSDTTASGTWGRGAVAPAVMTAAVVTPDLTVMSLGGNDAGASVAAATILTGIQNVLGYWSGPKILAHCYKVSGTSDTIWDAFTGSLYTQCDASGIAMLDWDDMVGRQAQTVTDSMVGTDGIHPTVAHQKMVGRMIARPLTGMLARPETVTLVEAASVYPPRPSTVICPPGYAHYVGADQPTDWLPGDSWDDLP
jgi:hypothetical protein